MSTPQISFWKVFWPSLTAIIVSSVFSSIFFFLFLGATIGAFTAGFETKKLQIEDNSILHLQLNEPITDKTNASFNPVEFKFDGTTGLVDLLVGIEEAKNDSKVKGIFIELSNLQCGMASLFELRKALEDFKESGKFIVAYNSGEVITQKEYLLTSVADENYGFPTSTMEFLGLGGEYMFFKNLFDKLDLEMQVIRGPNNDFKSAVEPYFLDKMSDSARFQAQRYLNSIWEDYLTVVSSSRGVSVTELDEIAENVKIRRTGDAVKYKLLDATKYQDEVYSLLKKKINKAEKDDLKLIKFTTYARKKAREKRTLDDAKDANIAVILAEGGIATDGEGIVSSELVKQIREAREEDDIKAVVFRVNSPGGSALASEEIWREITLTKEQKPVIVSMGNVAASGGYYISAPASRIFAESTTITGSIGVFGVIPYTGKMLEEKVGLSFDRISTNSHAVMSTNRKLTEDEMSIIQKEVDQIYEEFVAIVAKGRNLTPERVNAIARGRVWTGKDALAIGLVDELGGLNDAIAYAAKEVNIKEPIITYFPKSKRDQFMEILEAITEEEDMDAQMRTNSTLSQQVLTIMNNMKEIDNMKGIQMRMPYLMEIH